LAWPRRSLTILAGMPAARVALPPEEAATVTKALAAEGLYLTELRADEADLETVFLELTGEHPMAVAR
jgi:hypothetical protein